MRFIFIIFLFLSPASYSQDFLDQHFEEDGIIENFGDFSFSTGASIITLHADHSFSYSPAGVSGRMIQGWWKYNGSFYVIVGRWFWINGISSLDDYRMMTLDVRASFSINNSKGKGDNTLTPYWNIEYLDKVTSDIYMHWKERFDNKP